MSAVPAHHRRHTEGVALRRHSTPSISRLGLRTKATMAAAIGALVVSVALSIITFVLVRATCCVNASRPPPARRSPTHVSCAMCCERTTRT
jgi:hypothetical protein